MTWLNNKKQSRSPMSGMFVVANTVRLWRPFFWTRFHLWFSKVSANATTIYPHIDGLMQEKHNSSALAMELRLSCINPSILRNALYYVSVCVQCITIYWMMTVTCRGRGHVYTNRLPIGESIKLSIAESASITSFLSCSSLCLRKWNQ